MCCVCCVCLCVFEVSAGFFSFCMGCVRWILFCSQACQHSCVCGGCVCVRVCPCVCGYTNLSLSLSLSFSLCVCACMYVWVQHLKWKENKISWLSFTQEI